ncbi:MAG: glycosyltransferase family 92 protein [Rickettsiales bacterium]|nr:glycosyltransferase family 92 protein [Rickettsiales bacterium]
MRKLKLKAKKLLINIIAGFVPGRIDRDRFRNAMGFGLVKSIRARLAESKLEFPHKLSIVAIAKNEGEYFREWIEYHNMVGVEKFYIYDNESTDNTKEVLEPYIKSGLVEYTYWPGEKQQHHVYRDCLAKRKFDTKWLALIDLDEFLVVNGGGVLPGSGIFGRAAQRRVASIGWLGHVWFQWA